MGGMAIIKPPSETLMEFWRKPDPAKGRGYMAGFTLHCPDCGRFAKITAIATRLGVKLPRTASWQEGCAFKVYCKKDGESGWLL